MKKKKFIGFMGTAILVLSFGQLVSADSAHVWSGGYPSTVVSDLKYVTSGAPNSTYETNIMVGAANNWNNISSKVSISKNSNGAKMSISVGSTSNSGSLGKCFSYYRNAFGGLSEDTSKTEIWEVTDVYGYENQMNTFKMTESQKKSNFTHEVGHALSLAHVESSSSDTAVMKPGIQSIGPTTTDKSHLKLKWGN